jgi:transposase
MKNPEIARFGTWALNELQRLCHMAKAPPTPGEWNAFYARLIRLITLYHDRKDEAGTFARSLSREMESLWVFLEHEGISPTNNHAERMLRFAVLWRNRSQGTASEKGERWVERILSLRQTCRLAERKTYPVLVDALTCFFKEQQPDLSWIGRPAHKAL